MSTPAQPRCHLHLPIIDSAGNVFPYASITLLDADTLTPITTPTYVQPEGGNPVAFPLFAGPAIVDVWTEDPVRVQIVADVSDNVRIVLDGVDILPPASHIVRGAKGFEVTNADEISQQAVLMASEPGQAMFRVADPVGTHQHEGDSPGSVVLTNERPTDYNPFQTWVGHQAGRNVAPNTTGSSAFGGQAELSGASSTIMGQAGIVQHSSTGTSGDMATVLASEDGDATSGSTVVGPGNLTAQGRDMAVLGGLNGPSGPSAVPDGAVIVGTGNVFGAAGAVKIGPDHPASDAGPNHVAIGPGNVALNNGLPWAGPQNPFTIGGNTITIAGDPSDQTSADDWFGGVGPLAMGYNDTTWNPSIGLLQSKMESQALLRVAGDVVVNGQRTHSNTSTTLGFYGATGTTRPQVAANPVDNPINDAVETLIQHLGYMGLIDVVGVTSVHATGALPDGTPQEFAQTGQALQWKLPPTSPDYVAANPFTTASGKIVLNAAGGPYGTRGVPALYSAGRSNVAVEGTFTYNPSAAPGTNLIVNSNFDSDTSGWVTWDSGVGFVRSTAVQAQFGDGSGRITPGGSTTKARVAWEFSSPAGTQHNFSVWVRPTAGHMVSLAIDWFDGSSNYISSTYGNYSALPLNTWTRGDVGGTAPAGAVTAAATVGYSSGSNIPATDLLYIDGAMISTGSTALPPFVLNSGYHPNDLHTGLMLRSLHEKSILGGQTIATTKGYLIGRTHVYSMTGNTIASTITSHSTPVASGQVLRAECNGTSVVIKADGVQISTFTDSTWTTRVKYGFRLCPTTNVSEFEVSPFGF